MSKIYSLFNRLKLLDVVLILIVGLVAYFHFGRLLFGSQVITGYYDWYNQAFRVLMFQKYGLTSWIHETSNGQNIWQAFQFIPHAVTSYISTVFNLNISRTMLVLCFVSLEIVFISLYLVLVKLGSNRFISISVSVIAMGILQIATLIGDFSLLIGFMFTIAVTYLIYAKIDSWRYSYTAFLSMLIYVHPILAFFSLGHWVLQYTLSSKFKLRFLIYNVVLILLVSSYYISQALFYSGTFYIDSHQTDVSFIRTLMFPVNFGISYSYQWFLSLLILIALYKIQYVFKSALGKKAIVSVMYALSLALAIYINITYDFVPSFFNQFQLPRWLPFIYITLGLALGISVSIVRPYLNTKILIIVFALFIGFSVIEHKDYRHATSLKVHIPIALNEYVDPIAEYLTLPENTTVEPVIVTPASTQTLFFVPNIKSGNGYFHFSQNPMLNYEVFYINNSMAIPNALDDIITYYKIRGVTHLFLDKRSSLAKLAIEDNTNYKIDVTKFDDYVVIKLPWPTYKYLVVESTANIPALPGSQHIISYENLSSVNSFIAEYSSFVERALRNKSNVSVEFSGPEAITVKNIPAKSKIILTSSYDKNWTAKQTTGVTLSLEGPGYLAVANDTNQNINLVELTHKPPISNSIGLALSVVGVSGSLLSDAYIFGSSKKRIK